MSGFTIYDVPLNPDDPTCNVFRGRPLPEAVMPEDATMLTLDKLDAKARIKRLREALELYGRHLDGCDALVHYGHCTCGFTAARDS